MKTSCVIGLADDALLPSFSLVLLYSYIPFFFSGFISLHPFSICNIHSLHHHLIFLYFLPLSSPLSCNFPPCIHPIIFFFLLYSVTLFFLPLFLLFHQSLTLFMPSLTHPHLPFLPLILPASGGRGPKAVVSGSSKSEPTVSESIETCGRGD